MNANETALLDPFDVSTPDAATELNALTRALELAEGFSLLFVCCNQLPQRERLMEEVRTRLPKLNIQTLVFRAPLTHLLDAVRAELASPQPDAVFITGLEFSLPVAADAPTTPLVANLNAARNSFAQALPCPVVFWVPQYVLTAIMQGAPDFFSVRSGVYFFMEPSEESAPLAQNLSVGTYWEVASLSQQEKQDRVAAIERLLADYERLPNDQRNRHTELRLLGQLGDIFYTQGNYDEALAYFDRTLKIAEDLNDKTGVAASLQRIGGVQRERGNYEVALGYYQRSLKISEDIGDVGSSLHHMGLVQQMRGNYDASLDYYQRALKIAEEIGNVARVSASLGQIGNVQRARGNYEAALEYYQRALKIAEELGNVASVATSLYNIGIVQQARGNYEAALDCYQRSLKIREDIGDVAGVASSQGVMGRLLIETGHPAEAFRLFLNARSTFIQLQLPYARTAARDLTNLRGNWDGFDAAWRAATGDEVPDWLLQNDRTNA